MTLLADLVRTSQRVGATAARLSKVRELASFLRALPPDEIETAAHYLSGEIPQGRIGVGYSTLQAAAASGAASAETLSLAEVDRSLALIAAIRGAGSSARRAQALRELFRRATAPEQQFLLHLLVGELRQGALAASMVEAIAVAAELPVAQVRRAAMYSKSLGAVARAALLEGADALRRFQLELFSPVAPMLAQTAADVGEALTELQGEVAFEWKMDGARIQVHKGADEVRIYTRALNDVTGALPEIVAVARTLPGRTLVLDGEAIAFDAAGRPHPFQITMRRFGRKLNVEQLRAELPIKAFFFDCLRLDALSIADRPGRERAQDQACAHPRSGGVGGGVGPRPAHRQAFQSASGCAGAGRGRVRHARQDVQGPHRRHARMADDAAAGTRDSPGPVDRVRATGAGRGNRLQRPAGEQPLSARPGTAARPGQTLSGRQARRRRRYYRDG